MAYRISPDGHIHVDTVDELQAVLALRENHGGKRVNGTKVPKLAPNALEGRLLDILKERGALGPRDLVTEAKADRYSVNKALKALIARHLVKSQGATASRKYLAVKGNGKS